MLNMQMGRKVMEVVGQKPQLVVTIPLIEGTDGIGRKMSKSFGNYVALSAFADDMFGKVMSIPDRLMVPYLRAWTEWTDAEIDSAVGRIESATLHPMDLKKILAGEAVAAVHGVHAAMHARKDFTARFSSRRNFTDIGSLPVVSSSTARAETIGAVLSRVLEFTPSVSAARRIARQNGLRLILESEDKQEAVVLAEDAIGRPLAEVVAETLASAASVTNPSGTYLKTGRRVARIDGSPQGHTGT